jgi:hypothetical protein
MTTDDRSQRAQTETNRSDDPVSERRPAATLRLDDGEPSTTAVVNAVSKALRKQPLDLEPLSAQIDPDALETLLHGPIGQRERLSVVFQYEGCHVVVTPTVVEVYGPDDESGRD